MKRGRPSNREKILNKNSNDRCVAINITIPQKLLNNIEQNISGLSRSEKIVKCAEKGFDLVVSAQ